MANKKKDTLNGHFIRYTCSTACLCLQMTNRLMVRNKAATECVLTNKLLVGMSTPGQQAKAAPALGNKCGNDDGRNHC